MLSKLPAGTLLPCSSSTFSTSMASESNTFYYFAFGSNLLTERIHIKNPSAVMKSVGKVERYTLAFGHYVDVSLSSLIKSINLKNLKNFSVGKAM